MKITRKHNKSDADVRKAVDQIAKELKENVGIKYNWLGESGVSFSGTGISGNIKIEPGEVLIEMKKSFFLPVSEDKLRGWVDEYLDKYLE
ncbi:MAG: polyhydroxyalkanoic acid system family protein [Balneolales bacterium]|nr:polyhydroxyalkanoic acid system family protein [Balneolales bacterium]